MKPAESGCGSCTECGASPPQVAAGPPQAAALGDAVLAEVADSLGADPELLPLLPELLSGLQELGASSADVVATLASLGVGAGARVLDLGCGKGAVAVALAQSLGVSVDGVDAFAPFVAASRVLAEGRGVAARCRFWQDDVRRLLAGAGDYDVALLLGLDALLAEPGLGERLQRLVRPGGYVVVGCAGDFASRLTLFGAPVREVERTLDETRAVERRNAERIRLATGRLQARRPEVPGLVDRYLGDGERQAQTPRVVAVLSAFQRPQPGRSSRPGAIGISRPAAPSPAEARWLRAEEAPSRE